MFSDFINLYLLHIYELNEINLEWFLRSIILIVLLSDHIVRNDSHHHHF